MQSKLLTQVTEQLYIYAILPFTFYAKTNIIIFGKKEMLKFEKLLS